MKTTITLLILFSSSYLLSQDIQVNISDYPHSIAVPLEKIMSTIDSENPEKSTNEVNGLKLQVENNKSGNRSTLKVDSDKSYRAQFKKNEQEKGAVIIEDLISGKNYGSFKIKSTKNSHYNSIAFSMDGKYLLAMGVEDRTVYSYVFDMESKKLIVDGRIVELNNSPSTMLKVGGIGNYMFGSGYYNRLFMVDITTGEPITLPMFNDVNDLNYLYPSIDSDFVLAVKEDSTYFFDTKNNRLLYAKRNQGNSPIKSIYVNADGSKTEKRISGKSIKGPGIGIVVVGESIMVFDQDQNYFTTCLNDEEPEVLEYISFKGENSVLEAQPDLIPIIADVLSDKAKFILYKELTDIFFNKSIESEALCHRVFDSGEPHSKQFLLDLDLTTKGGDFIVRNHFVIPLIEAINSSTNIELASSGKDANQKLLQQLKDYEQGVKFMEEDFKKPYIADKDALADAKNKLQIVSSDLYYMSVDELIQKGNQAVTTGASLSPTAALLGVKFYEVAAEKEPNEPVHQILIANAYANANKYDKALEYYNKALAMKPNYPLALFGLTKTSFMPVQKGQKSLDENLAKSIIANADRYLEVAPDDYQSETTAVKTYKGLCQLYLDDIGLYTSYNLAVGISDVQKRSAAVASLVLKVEATGNKYLAAYMANMVAFDFVTIAESKNNDKTEYLKADAMFDKSIKSGVYDAKTYYEWASININELKRNDEGLRIIEEAKKHYPTDLNFDKLASNLYYNKGRELYMAKSYSKAIPYFESYISSASSPIVKANDYLGFSYFRTKNYPKAAENLQKLNDKENANTLQAFYPNFNAVLAYAKSPSGTAPVVKDNGDKIDAMQEKYEKGIAMGGAAGLKLMEEAANYYDQINYDYGQGIVHSGVGVAYHRAGNKSLAKNHYQKCIDNGATSSSCYNNLAMIYTDEKSLNSAKSVLDKGWSKFPNAPDLKKTYAEYYIQMGFNEYGKKSYYSAITNFKKCISYNDSDAWAHMYLGYSYYATGKSYDAKTSLRKAVQIDPKLRNDYPAITQILNQ